MIVHLDKNKVIEGIDFRELIEWCFQRTTFFGLNIYLFNKSKINNVRIPEELEKHLILKTEFTFYPNFNAFIKDDKDINIRNRYNFQLCDETKKYILENCNSTHDWINNRREDLIFFRNDGEELLYFLPGESLCGISCSKKEFSSLPNNSLWTVDYEDYVRGEGFY